MKPSKKKEHGRFHKLVSHIVEKQSPSREVTPMTDKDDDEMGIEEEAGAVDQEGKKARRKLEDENPNDLI